MYTGILCFAVLLTLVRGVAGLEMVNKQAFLWKDSVPPEFW